MQLNTELSYRLLKTEKNSGLEYTCKEISWYTAESEKMENGKEWLGDVGGGGRRTKLCLKKKKKQYSKKTSWEFSRFGERQQSSNSGSPVNPEQDKYKEMKI